MNINSIESHEKSSTENVRYIQNILFSLFSCKVQQDQLSSLNKIRSRKLQCDEAPLNQMCLFAVFSMYLASLLNYLSHNKNYQVLLYIWVFRSFPPMGSISPAIFSRHPPFRTIHFRSSMGLQESNNQR